MGDFDAATAVRRTAAGRYTAELDRDWFVFTGPNGGYLASVLLNALTDAVADPGRPARSLTVHFTQPSTAGPVTVDVQPLRSGKSLSFLTARLVQDERLIAHATAVFGTNTRAPALDFQDHRREVPPPGERPPPWVEAGFSAPIEQHFHYRPVNVGMPFAGGDASAFDCWAKLRTPRPADPALLATLVDAFIPAIFLRAPRPVVAPTIDLTVHFRQPADDRPAGWFLGHAATRTSVDGFLEEDFELYDGTGRLLAHSRQLAMLLPMG